MEEINLEGKLDLKWGDFNKNSLPLWFELNPGKSSIASGLECGALSFAK